MWIHMKLRTTAYEECDVCFHTSQIKSITCEQFGDEYYRLTLNYTNGTMEKYVIQDWNVYANLVNAMRATSITSSHII